MSNRPNDAIEAAVIERLTGLLDATARRIDDGTADSLHDYELELPDGRTVAVEVTGEVDDTARATNAATRKHRLTNSDVTTGWEASLTDWNAPRRALARHLPSMLTEYEKAGRHYVAFTEDQRLAALGVAAVERHDKLVGAGIWLTHVGPGGSIVPIDVVDAVTDHGTRTDNVAKLTRTSVNARHLAVWVEVTAGDTYAALNDFGLLPDEDPAVDPVIDLVWALRLDHSDAGLDIDVVWSWQRKAGWSYHGRSPTVLSLDA